MRRPVVIVALAVLLSAPPAALACELDGPGRCYPEFRAFTAVTADGATRLVAVGPLRSPAERGYEIGIAAVEPPGDAVTVAAPAEALEQDGLPLRRLEGRDIVRVANGEFVVLGVAIYGESEDEVYSGWAARVGLDGGTRWSRTYPGPARTHQMLQFGLRLRDGGLLAGGRRQLGPDPGDCSVWSRSLLVPIDAGTGEPVREVVDGEEGARRAYYAAAEMPDGRIVLTGFGTAPSETDAGKCQDDFLSVTTGPGLDSVEEVQFGTPGEDIGLDVAIVEGRRIEVGAATLEGPVAVVNEIAENKGLPLFRPQGGPAGRDKLAAIVRSPATGEVFVAGSWSESAKGWFRAWWFRFDKGMELAEEAPVAAYPGSSIDGLGVRPDGKVVGVGYVRPTEGDATEQYGWAVEIAPGASGSSPGIASVRPADSALPPLEGLDSTDSAFQAGSIGSTPAAFYHGPAAAASRYVLAFDLGAAASVRAVVHPEGGDIDIALRAADGALVDFSNYRGAATELVEAAVPAGRYRLEMLVSQPVAAFDVSVARAGDGLDFLASLQAPMALGERLDIAAVLAGSGYYPGSEIALSVSPETVRAFAALEAALGEEMRGIVDEGAWAAIAGR